MNKTISRCIFISAIAVWIILSIAAPTLISDKNDFLKDFVNHELLNLLGVIVAITLASAANLHLEFNKIEDAAKKIILTRTREAVKKSSSWLIIVFGMAFILVVVKPLVVSDDVSASLINGLAILIVLFNILVLIDLTKLVFRIEPMFKMMPNADQHNDNGG